jgi:alanyl-tRNA synthetase
MVGGYVLHVGRVRSGCIRVGDEVIATVSPDRFPTMQNHTGTHLANWALREVLGDGVEQKGSLVDPLKLRFDFSYGKSLGDEQVAQVETLVGQCIARRMPVYAQVVPQEQALKINGLRAVFGEKYPPMVRVVSIGVPVEQLLEDPLNPRWRQYSIEFCGGTHLRNTAEVEEFVITSEESVSKGVRRIVALTGAAARAAAQRREQIEAAIAQARTLPESQLARELHALQKQLGANDVPLLTKRRGQAAIAELQARYRAWEKSQQRTAASIDIGATAAELISGGPIIVAAIEAASDEQLRGVIDSIRKRSSSFAALLASSDGQRVSFVAAVSDDLIARGLKAGDWVREAAKVTGGGGGGRPQMAQAGGKDPSRLPDALQAARQFARKILE